MSESIHFQKLKHFIFNASIVLHDLIINKIFQFVKFVNVYFKITSKTATATTPDFRTRLQKIHPILKGPFSFLKCVACLPRSPARVQMFGCEDVLPKISTWKSRGRFGNFRSFQSNGAGNETQQLGCFQLNSYLYSRRWWHTMLSLK